MARYLWPELADVPHEVGFLDAAGVRTRFLRVGDPTAPPLLLLHGFGSHLETFVRNAGALSADRGVFAIDLVGHGYTEAPGGRLEIVDYVAHARACAAALALDRPALVGVALGSWVAARWAIDFPAEVGALTLAAPTGLGADPETMATVRRLSLDAVREPDAAKARRRLAAVLTKADDVPGDLVENRLAVLCQPHAERATADVLALQDMEVRRRSLLTPFALGTIVAPTLVVSGGVDLLSPVAVGDEFAAAIPASRRLVVEGAGHWLHFEHPDEFNVAEIKFLEEAG
jgi:2-hydroxy-6-oxonona-2,4-dienedioate hydrolase